MRSIQIMLFIFYVNKPDSVSQIGRYIFASCHSLKNANCLFKDCNQLD